MEVYRKTPDEEVAEKILLQFQETKLLSEKGIKKIGESLSTGNLSSEDWRLIFETDRLEKEDQNACKSQ